MWDGFSPETAMAPWIDVLESMDACQFTGFKNQVGFDAVLEMDAAMEDPGEEAMKRLTARIQERQGEGGHRKVLGLAPGAKLTYPRGVAPYEMDYVGSGDQKKDWALAGWGVSKFMAGLSEDVNKASSYTARKNFFHKTVRPRLLLIDGYGTERMARRFDDGLVIYHDDPYADDPEEIRANLTLALQGKCVTVNEMRQQLLGLEPLEGGDVIFGSPTDTPILGPDAETGAEDMGKILETLQVAKQPPQPEGMPGMPGEPGGSPEGKTPQRNDAWPMNRLKPQANGTH
jgi:hypothetical protein